MRVEEDKSAERRESEEPPIKVRRISPELITSSNDNSSPPKKKTRITPQLIQPIKQDVISRMDKHPSNVDEISSSHETHKIASVSESPKNRKPRRIKPVLVT